MSQPALPMDEPVVDQGAFSTMPDSLEEDINSHRNSLVYVGFHVPKSDESKKRRHRRKRKKKSPEREAEVSEPKPKVDPIEEEAADGVLFQLGEQDQKDDADENDYYSENDSEHEPHEVFVEMDELAAIGDQTMWKETARWIKFEEDVEEGGDRWSKPHVASLHLRSLMELRNCLEHGVVLLDMEAESLEEIADLVIDSLIAKGHLNESNRDNVREALLRRHLHQHDKKPRTIDAPKQMPIIRSLAEIRNRTSQRAFNEAKEKDSGTDLTEKAKEDDEAKSNGSPLPSTLSVPAVEKLKRVATGEGSLPDGLHESDSKTKMNKDFMRKIPAGAEASNVLVGSVDFLERPIIAFMRLAKAIMLGDLTEVLFTY